MEILSGVHHFVDFRVDAMRFVEKEALSLNHDPIVGVVCSKQGVSEATWTVEKTWAQFVSFECDLGDQVRAKCPFPRTNSKITVVNENRFAQLKAWVNNLLQLPHPASVVGQLNNFFGMRSCHCYLFVADLFKLVYKSNLPMFFRVFSYHQRHQRTLDFLS